MTTTGDRPFNHLDSPDVYLYAFDGKKAHTERNYGIGKKVDISNNQKATSKDTMKLLVAHEFGHVLGLTDIYNNAEINRIYDINSNGDKTLYQYSLMICNEVPDNNIMRLKYNNDSYIVNLNNIEMVLVAAYENRPQAYIHHLGDQLISNNGNVDYSKFVLSKAIREPIVVETRKTYGISTSSEQTYYLDKYSLELKPVVNN